VPPAISSAPLPLITPAKLPAPALIVSVLEPISTWPPDPSIAPAVTLKLAVVVPAISGPPLVAKSTTPVPLVMKVALPPVLF